MSRHGTALDTLRWGDAQNVQIVNGALAIETVSITRQLAQARWRWPLMWGLRIGITPQVGNGETLTFTVQYKVTIGCGQNSADMFFNYTIAPAAGLYLPVTDFIELPAQDIQVIATVNSPGGSGVTDNFQVSAFLAPTTEPHAMTHLFEHLVEGDPEGVRWTTEHHQPSAAQPGTGLGFPINPDPLHYQRR